MKLKKRQIEDLLYYIEQELDEAKDEEEELRSRILVLECAKRYLTLLLTTKQKNPSVKVDENE